MHILNEIETRVLASLVEKQITTPEYYPLTLNALVQACNQKTNREPVTSFDEETVSRAVDALREKNLVYVFHGAGSRVMKYKHLLPEVYELNYAETALICALMLRGAQTVGELRERGGRMFEFSGLAEVEENLNNLISREEPMVMRLPRQIGQKETRFVHLIAGEPDLTAIEAAPTANRISGSDKIAALEAKVEELTAEVKNLREMFEDFKKQFE